MKKDPDFAIFNEKDPSVGSSFSERNIWILLGMSGRGKKDRSSIIGLLIGQPPFLSLFRQKLFASKYESI